MSIGRMKMDFILRSFLLSSFAVISFVSCNGNKADQAFCDGQVIEETLMNAETRKISRKIYIACAGECKDGKPCDSIVKNYDPPLAGGVIREVWCGCRGEQTPQGCTVVLQTVLPGSDTFLRRARCTPRDRNCPSPGDSCLPRYRSLRDTIRSVITQKDSIYRYKWITTCECMNRSS